MLLFARSMTLHGSLSAWGSAGTVAPDTNDAGNGGGGSGGAIYLRVGWLNGTGDMSSFGGPGPGSQTTWNSPGGDGGAGRIRVDYHHAAGFPWGSAVAADFLNTISEPDPGATALQLD